MLLVQPLQPIVVNVKVDTDYVSIITCILTAIAAYSTFRIFTLQKKHNKNDKAVEFLENWNNHIHDHRRQIEKLMPGVTRFYNCKAQSIKPAIAYAINNSISGTHFELKYHFMELLDYFEVVAIAYEKGTVDRKVITTCLQGRMQLLHLMVLCALGRHPTIDRRLVS